MVLFRSQRLLSWSEEFVPSGAARGAIPNDQNNNRRFPNKTMTTETLQPQSQSHILLVITENQ